jgi:DNA polymerase III delta subunit
MIKVLVGPNRFALQKSLQKSKSEFAKKHGDLAIESFDAEEVELDVIQEALKSISLFTPQKMVVVHSLSANKQATENIEKIINSTPEHTEFLVVEPKPDKRSTYYKALKNHTDLQEFSELDEHQLVDWLTSEAKSLGGDLSRADAQYFIKRVGARQGKLYHELLKLIDYNQRINRETIDLLTEENPENTVFELLDAAFAGHLSRTLQLYENLRKSDVQPPMIIGMLAWQMHLVALTAAAGDRSIGQIAKESGAKPYALQKSQRLAKIMGAHQIKSILADLESLDLKLKTESIDADAALKNLFSKIAIS